MTAPSLLAIDPGTVVTGLALFADQAPVRTLSIIPGRLGATHRRIGFVVDEVERILDAYVHVQQVACEAWRGPRNPYLQVLIADLHSLIRQRNLEWYIYHNSVVKSAVKLRGWRGPAKYLLRQGIVALYGEQWGQVAQDEVDALAVGHCHLAHVRERSLEGGET